MDCQGHQLWPQVLSRLQGRFSLLPASTSLRPQPRVSRLGASPEGGGLSPMHPGWVSSACDLGAGCGGSQQQPGVEGNTWQGVQFPRGRPTSRSGLPDRRDKVQAQLQGALVVRRGSWLHWPGHVDPAQGPQGAAGRCAGLRSGLAQQIFPVAGRAPRAGTRAPGWQVRAPRSRRFAGALCRPPAPPAPPRRGEHAQDLRFLPHPCREKEKRVAFSCGFATQRFR